MLFAVARANVGRAYDQEGSMTTQDQIQRLIHDANSGNYSRRQLLQRAAAMGLSFSAAVTLFTGAIPLSAYAQDASPAPGATNPLGVDPAAPLDVVIFDGGLGDEYAINVNDNLYGKLYPDAQITYAGIQGLGAQLQPRFVGGNPPDVIDNSGAGNLDMGALVSEGQLADLSDLMAAPSYDTEGATFADTLVPGSQDTGVFNGQQLYLNYALTVAGLWYSQPWMESKGYTYPKTWAEMIDLCAEIKGSGISPWVTTGVHPQYMQNFVFQQMIYKHDPAAQIAIDNLEPDAWKSDTVTMALEALYQLAENDYILSGWEALDHTQSQAEWLQGKGAFLPCGTWLQNEMGDLVPPDFNMVVAPIPSLEGDQLPFEAIFATAGEPFIVPAQGKNVQGGKEWLRLLFSKEGGSFFAESTNSLSVVVGSGDGLDLGSSFSSTQEAIANAGANTLGAARFQGWYKDLYDEARFQLGALLQKQISIEEYQDTVQEMADQVKDDDGIEKFTRES
jgi:N-acetylglucosamine transport system substrate-binding protein